MNQPGGGPAATKATVVAPGSPGQDSPLPFSRKERRGLWRIVRAAGQPEIVRRVPQACRVRELETFHRAVSLTRRPFVQGDGRGPQTIGRSPRTDRDWPLPRHHTRVGRRSRDAASVDSAAHALAHRRYRVPGSTIPALRRHLARNPVAVLPTEPAPEPRRTGLLALSAADASGETRYRSTPPARQPPKNGRFPG